jgi:quercetin dioxygenase-like cupin family protein
VPFIKADDLDVKEPRQGWRGRFFHSAHMTFAQYTVSAGAAIHEHSHPNDEVWNVLEGELEITVAGRRTRVKAGDAAVVPPNTRHAVRAVTDARALVVDHPRRDSIGDVEI